MLEYKIRRILTEELLREAASLDKIVKTLVKSGPDERKAPEIGELIMADPTAVENGRGRFVGKYWKWIYNQYKQGNVHEGDIPELRAALNTYNINKTRINKPIEAFNTLDELVSEIAQYDDSFKAGRTLSKGEQELEKVYEDEYVTVYVPHTWEAARKIGGDTRWCTASSSDYRFNYYLNKYGGEYYDIIRKRDGEKFQIHPESGQFMDSEDEETDFLNVFGMKREAEGVIGFLENSGKEIGGWLPRAWPEDALYMLNSGESPYEVFDEVGDFEEGIATVRLDCVMNYIKMVNGDYELLSSEWFDECWPFRDGYGVVLKDGKCNYINKEGRLLSNEWFDECWPFSDGCGKVKKDGKWYKINEEGELLDYDTLQPLKRFNESIEKIISLIERIDL